MAGHLGVWVKAWPLAWVWDNNKGLPDSDLPQGQLRPPWRQHRSSTSPFAKSTRPQTQGLRPRKLINDRVPTGNKCYRQIRKIQGGFQRDNVQECGWGGVGPQGQGSDQGLGAPRLLSPLCRTPQERVGMWSSVLRRDTASPRWPC